MTTREELIERLRSVRQAEAAHPRVTRGTRIKSEPDGTSPKYCDCHYTAIRGATNHLAQCHWWKSGQYGRAIRAGMWDQIKKNERHVMINGQFVRVADNTTKIGEKGYIKK